MSQMLRRQLALAQQRLQGQRPAVGRQAVNVAGCNSDYGCNIVPGAGQYGAQRVVTPDQVIQKNYAPFSITAQAAAAEQTVQASPRAGIAQICGVRSCNDAMEVTINGIRTAGVALDQLAGPTDASAWNTVECFCPVNWGCVSPQQQLEVDFVQFGSPSPSPFLCLIVFTTWVQAVDSCYPGLPLPPSSVPPMNPAG